MYLKELLNGIYAEKVPAEWQEFLVSDISSDSRRINDGSVFLAVQGAGQHGREYVHDAIKRGAKVVICDKASEANIGQQVLTIVVPDTNEMLERLCKKFYGFPGQKLKVIGITGTNGKTTVTYLLESIFKQAGKTCGVIGTINYRIGDRCEKANNTTPGIADNFRLMRDMAEQGCEYCVMEVSSHALKQNRVRGLDFEAAVFTNLTGDHLDYHKNMEDYFLSKSKLFEGLKPGMAAVINGDDPYGKTLVERSEASPLIYGLTGFVDIRAVNLKKNVQGAEFIVKQGDEEFSLSTALIGTHNVYNILAAVGVALSEGISSELIRSGVLHCCHIPGRMERIAGTGRSHVFVDYAHTEDGLRNVLLALNEIKQKKIILVFGCGGDRDTSKRKKMGKVACDLADFSFVTNDNPRTEDPEIIVKQILSGFVKENFEVTYDRASAIEKALQAAKEDDIVLIAGKGHEDYQIFSDKTIHFSDKEIVQCFFKEK